MDVIIAVSDHDPTTAAALGHAVRGVAAAHGTVNAALAGTSEDEVWGTEYAHWVAVTFDTETARNLAQVSVRKIAETYGQDAVAWTEGETSILDTAPARVG